MLVVVKDSGTEMDPSADKGLMQGTGAYRLANADWCAVASVRERVTVRSCISKEGLEAGQKYIWVWAWVLVGGCGSVPVYVNLCAWGRRRRKCPLELGKGGKGDLTSHISPVGGSTIANKTEKR